MPRRLRRRASTASAAEGAAPGPRLHGPRHLLAAARRRPSAGSPTPMTRRSTCAWTPTQELSAREVVNEWPQERLATALREFGEERHARSIAAEIVRRRPLETTSELVEAIRAAVPPAYRFGRGHPAKRSFQAIRIAVNGELESLDRALPAAWSLLPTGGRLAAIASTRSRTAGSSASSPSSPAAASARPSCRSASAGTSPRPSCSPGARSSPTRGRDRAQPALALGPPAGGAQARGAGSTGIEDETRRGRRWRRQRQPDDGAPRARAARTPRRAARARAAPAPAPADADRGLRPGRRRAHRRRRRRASPIRASSCGSPAAAFGSACSAALLVGIVALNVIALSFSASSSDAARQADELERQNSALRGPDRDPALERARSRPPPAGSACSTPARARSATCVRPPATPPRPAQRLRDGRAQRLAATSPPTEAPIVPEATVPVETTAGRTGRDRAGDRSRRRRRRARGDRPEVPRRSPRRTDATAPRSAGGGVAAP